MKAFAYFGLIAEERNTNPGTSGTSQVGLAPTRMELSLDDAIGEAYRSKVFTVLSTGAGNVATYSTDSGVVTQTTGTPTISRATAVDHEGNAYVTLGDVLALLVEIGGDNEGTVALACTATASPDVPAMAAGTKMLIAVAAPATGNSLGTGDVALTFSASGDSATVTLVQATSI